MQGSSWQFVCTDIFDGEIESENNLVIHYLSMHAKALAEEGRWLAEEVKPKPVRVIAQLAIIDSDLDWRMLAFQFFDEVHT